MTKSNLPVFNIPRVLKLRDKLRESLVVFCGTQLKGAEFDLMVETVTEILPNNIEFASVYESMSHLAGKELTSSMLSEISWRLAGNIDVLASGKSVGPWIHQSDPEWVPVQVMSSSFVRQFDKKPSYQYRLQTLAGSPCPMIIWKTWPIKACGYIARNIGFTAAHKQFGFSNCSELVSTRFLVKIEAKHCRGNQPGFWSIACSSGLMAWNRKLLKARAHISPPCPARYTHPCHQCFVGYDNCIAGTHPKTYVKSRCSVCASETWHDPEGDVCVQCRHNTM